MVWHLLKQTILEEKQINNLENLCFVYGFTYQLQHFELTI